MNKELEGMQAEVTQMEHDRGIVKNLAPANKEEIKDMRDDIADFIENRIKTENFMLLSNELRYYTLFKMKSLVLTPEGKADKLIEFITEDKFLKTLGKLKVLKRNYGGDIEIWIGETYFLFFDADSFFVEI